MPQHDCMTYLSLSSGSGNMQIGQSPKWLFSGCLNKISSRSSSIRLLQSLLCCGLWFRWHSTLQYCTSLQPLHFFNLIVSSASAVPTNSACRRLLLLAPLHSWWVRHVIGPNENANIIYLVNDEWWWAQHSRLQAPGASDACCTSAPYDYDTYQVAP